MGRESSFPPQSTQGMCELFLEEATWSGLSAAGHEVTPACTQLRVGPRAAANSMWGKDPQEESAGGLGPGQLTPYLGPSPLSSGAGEPCL